ncbi:MAG: helix-turn-helix transcriptional regulator [Anaerolineaceae bacterium]|nr:helix-turn-helix transcriptional regulator [Anaerolineaceae bacterium]
MSNQYIPERFGEKLRALRKLQGMSIQTLAQQLGYSAHGYISEIETGKKPPTLEFALKIAALFGVSTDQLLNDHLDVLIESESVPMTDLPFIDRPPTEKEIERLRLILSTYQDGTGMIKAQSDRTLPGWRDFERACALTFNGTAVENKFFVDVIFPLESQPPTFYGIDCKMRRELRSLENRGIIYIEVTNAAKLLWSHLASRGVTEANFRDEPEAAGKGLIDAVETLKRTSSTAYPDGLINLERSSYFVLLWDTNGDYQLFQLPLRLPAPEDLRWTCFIGSRADGTETTRLVGETDAGILYEWYGESGGQFKYYPPVSAAVWQSERFRLEPLPAGVEQGILAKTRAYFPALWDAASE